MKGLMTSKLNPMKDPTEAEKKQKVLAVESLQENDELYQACVSNDYAE